MMTIRQALIIVTLVFVALPVDGAGPQILGERARDLSPTDVSDIVALTSKHGSAWFLQVGVNFFMRGPNLQVAVYLAPDQSSSIIRRGRYVNVYQAASTAGSGYVWNIVGHPMAWAQVPPLGGEFSTKLTKPKKHDHPFGVRGDVSDADLISLVAFIRTSPEQPQRMGHDADGSDWMDIGLGVDGTNPVSGIEKKADCFFVVTTSSRPGAGQTVEVSRTDRGWQVVNVSEWVV
jgi:hypothetical protein